MRAEVFDGGNTHSNGLRSSRPRNQRPENFENLVDLVGWRAAMQGARPILHFRDDRDSCLGRASFEALDLRARGIGALLQGYGEHQRPVLLCLDSGKYFVESFLGCMYGGAIGVPTSVAPHPRHIARLVEVIMDCRPRVGLTTSAIKEAIQAMAPEGPAREIRWLTVDSLPDGIDGLWRRPEISESSLAFLQYTSGSTGYPKGVMVSHGNLIANLVQIRSRFGCSEEDRMWSWLPQFHDMGLVGGILQPLFAGMETTLCPPAWFIRKPSRWLEAVSEHEVTLSGAPNFAYELCVRRPVEDVELRLDSWELAFSGAEPIRAATLERFREHYARHGFRARSFFPCYGLAEATLMVAGTPRGRGPRIMQRSEEGRTEGQVCTGSEAVSSGLPVQGQVVLIVDSERRVVLPEGEVGEIWVNGRNVALGYWNRPEATRDTFGAELAEVEGSLPKGPYLKTGDHGYMMDGELYVVGRIKDMLIIRGSNFYPQDIEGSVEGAHTALRSGCCACFGLTEDDEDRLILVQEARDENVDVEEVAARVRSAVWAKHGLQVHAIGLLRKHGLPKTTSGKVRRHAAREGYLNGTLDMLAHWQVEA